jgi:rubrerythrin
VPPGARASPDDERWRHTHLAGRASSATRGDLQIACNLECYARERCLVHAEQADEQGDHRIASLMRAAAQGEAVRAASEAADIVRPGGKPTAEITPVVTRPTA